MGTLCRDWQGQLICKTWHLQLLSTLQLCIFYKYSKTCLKRPLKRTPTIFFKNIYRLMQVKSIAECSKGLYFLPSLSYHFPLRSLFCLFLSGHLRQVLLYSKTCLKRPLKRRTPTIGFQYRLLLNAGQKYCRMLQGEHSAILSTSIKLSFSIKTLVLSIFEWLLKTGFTVARLSFLYFWWFQLKTIFTHAIRRKFF